MAKNTGRGTRAALSEPRGADGRPTFYEAKTRGGAFAHGPSRWRSACRGLWRRVTVAEVKRRWLRGWDGPR